MDRMKLRFLALTAFFAGAVVVSLGLGRYFIAPETVVRILFTPLFSLSPDWTPQAETVLYGVRLPRVLMGVLIGAGLSCAGAVYQSVFQNPLVSPDLLGASAGSGLGAALGLYMELGYIAVSVCAFSFGLFAVATVVLIASRVRGNPVLGLLLSGIMVASLCTAGISFLKLVADPANTLPVITYWLMGSLASIRPQDILFAAPPILLGTSCLLLLRWRINVLSVGDEEAQTMGVPVRRVRGAAILCATFVTAACVSVSGMIGWVGLVVPHLARSLVGGDCRRSIPASILMGGAFLPIADDFSRMLATSEVPIGILTAFAGAPFFLYLILREEHATR